MTPTVLMASFLFLTCALFVEANSKRATIERIGASADLQRAAKAFGWGLAGSALFLIAQHTGWARGIPIWLAVFMVAGFANLLVYAFSPRWIARLAIVCLAVIVVTSVTHLVAR